MAKEMLALLRSSLPTLAWVGMTLPALACTNGVLPLELLPVETRPDAGSQAQGGTSESRSDSDGSGGAGKSGGRAGGGGPFGEPRAGTGGMRLPPRCDGYWEPEQEDALREAFNDAIANGHLCPRESSGLSRRLVQDTDLQLQAHGTICFTFGAPPGGGWSPYPGSTALGWVLSGTSSLEEAKKALLEGDSRSALCDAARNMTYRAIGVGHRGEWWSVVISPGVPEDMHRDDMQKP